MASLFDKYFRSLDDVVEVRQTFPGPTIFPGRIPERTLPELPIGGTFGIIGVFFQNEAGKDLCLPHPCVF